MAYLHRTPFFVRWLYPDLKWKEKSGEQLLYLTFDDGPVPEATPQVLEILLKYKIKATFFCVGDNIRKHPDIFMQVLSQGHTIGNHTYNHLNGWKTPWQEYYENTKKCHEEIGKYAPGDNLFRPPYGKISGAQIKALKNEYKIVMWDVLSGDFDPSLSAAECLKKTIKATRDGSIIVFHDSIKALDKIQNTLPYYIEHFLARGYKFLPL